MTVLEITFWLLIFIVFYAYIGYGILLYSLILLKRFTGNSVKKTVDSGYEPDVTLFIAAYNEKDFVAGKVKNSLELDYPSEKLHMVWVKEGFDDVTPDLLKKYKEVADYSFGELVKDILIEN